MSNYYKRFGRDSKYVHKHSPNYIGDQYEYTDENGEIKDAKTFPREERFYYINFIDSNGHYDSKYSDMIENRQHAINRAKWYTQNKRKFSDIPYYVVKVGVYDSKHGHICDFDV